MEQVNVDTPLPLRGNDRGRAVHEGSLAASPHRNGAGSCQPGVTPAGRWVARGINAVKRELRVAVATIDSASRMNSGERGKAHV